MKVSRSGKPLFCHNWNGERAKIESTKSNVIATGPAEGRKELSRQCRAILHWLDDNEQIDWGIIGGLQLCSDHALPLKR